MQRAAFLAIPAVESRSFRVIVLNSNRYRVLRCQNALTAIIGAKGFLDALSNRHTATCLEQQAGDRNLPRNNTSRPP
jgi:hypothetical protein